jgi:hypothetical protein
MTRPRATPRSGGTYRPAPSSADTLRASAATQQTEEDPCHASEQRTHDERTEHHQDGDGLRVVVHSRAPAP